MVIQNAEAWNAMKFELKLEVCSRLTCRAVIEWKSDMHEPGLGPLPRFSFLGEHFQTQRIKLPSGVKDCITEHLDIVSA